MAKKRKCRMCSADIPESRHTNAVTCGDVCADENDRNNRRRIAAATHKRLRAARLNAEA